MLYAILSDIHSNLEAYEVLISVLKEEKPDKTVVVGDIVGYGADPKECIRLTKFLTEDIVCGNHDRATAGLMDINWFNDNAKKAILWTKEVIDESEKEFLRSFKLTFEDENIIVVHASLHNPQDFNYIFDANDAYETFLKMDKKPCFIGHTHSPVIFIKDRIKGIELTFEQELELEKDRKYIINAGSIGQPRDGDNRASYVIYDTEKQHITIKRIEYDIRNTQQKILAADLPAIFAYRLSEGR